MSLRRGDRVPPPLVPGQWDVRFLNNESAKGWEELGNQAPGNTNNAFWTMRQNPTPRTDTPRHHRLKGRLATGKAGGRVHGHWQLEVTGAGRVWYLVDREKATVWIGYAGPGHPKATG